MPNRIIKESAFTSDKIAQLSDFEFRLWIGLITQADDTGRGDARPAIIKGRVFALRERTTVKDIDNALHALAAAGCVSLYTVGGKPYFQFPRWSAHQRVRNVVEKYPGPDDSDNPPQLAATCGDLRRPAADCGLNPIQSNTNTNPNPNPKVHAHGEYGWVKLTDEQYAKLVEDLGQEETDRCIAYVDESAQGNHNKNRWSDWNLVVRKCHRDGWGLKAKAKPYANISSVSWEELEALKGKI